MIKVGVTGGIGSGKSTVCRLLGLWGIPTYDSDQRAKDLLNHDPALRLAVEAIFGPQAYDKQELNRAFVAERVFTDAALLQQLNGVVHPAVEADFARWADGWQTGETGAAGETLRAEMKTSQRLLPPPYVIQESAILLECGADRGVDVVVTVSALEELRVERAARRDGCERELVRRRLRNQWTDAQREARATLTLRSDERELLIPQVEALHKMLLSR